MQNNNIEYLRKSIKKLSRFNYLSLIISMLISCFQVINAILASSKIIDVETFLIVFLCLEIIYYLSKLTKSNLIESIDKSEELKELVENCSNFSKEELDDCRSLFSDLIKSINCSLILAAFIEVTRCQKQLKESTEDK